jgi:hypothetical protein
MLNFESKDAELFSGRDKIKKPQKISEVFLKCGESRIRTCEVFTADLQSALVGRLSISPLNR